MAEVAGFGGGEIWLLYAGGLDAFEQALVGRDMHAQLRAGEEHLEGVADGRRAELFPMNVAVGPAARLGSGDHVLDHAGGTADVYMRAQGLSREQRLVRDHLAFTVIVHVKSFALA